jgi:DNA polymerase-1
MELIQCIKEGKDLHRLTASKIFNKEENEVNDEERQIGKTANFQLLFGTGAEHFRDELEKKTGKKHNLRDVKKIIKAFKKGYPEIANWQEEIAAMFNDDPDGKGVPYPYVTTLSGKQIYVEEYNKALNYAIAGTEAEIIKKAVVSFGEEIRDRALDAQVINLVHDNVVVECSIEDKEESSKLLKEALETSFNLTLKQFLTTVEIKTLSETPMNNENSSNGGINEKE